MLSFMIQIEDHPKSRWTSLLLWLELRFEENSSLSPRFCGGIKTLFGIAYHTNGMNWPYYTHWEKLCIKN